MKLGKRIKVGCANATTGFFIVAAGTAPGTEWRGIALACEVRGSPSELQSDEPWSLLLLSVISCQLQKAPENAALVSRVIGLAIYRNGPLTPGASRGALPETLGDAGFECSIP